jgi:selenocysteine-specific elongation factor
MAVTHANITLGTAGHIDHGKTALVRSLTGCETDRLKEEKERGMSIDLGYAPCLIGDTQVGIVDVPGHEHFVKTMVAGASGMDGVILVVAADDGIMPQTREHLDILTLLGIRHGLVALTKIDRVAPDDLELARAELEEFLRGTFLEAAPILPLSNVTAEGFDKFFEALFRLLESIEPKRCDGVFRVPLDRAFSAKGHGTVVAGIPVSGSAKIDDEIVLLPQGISGRIKRIQVYGRNSDTVMAGQCAAINVSHWEHAAIRRGDTIALPGYFGPHDWFVGSLRLLPHDKLILKTAANVKFHTGTTEVNASVFPIEGNVMQGGGEYLVQVRTEAPVVAGPGDRFILRTLSPVRTVGGGTIVEPIPRKLKRTRPGLADELHDRAAAIGDEAAFVEQCIRRPEGVAAAEAELAARAKLLRPRLHEILARLVQTKRVFALAPGLFVHRETAAEVGRQVLDVVAEYHRKSPESPGIAADQLRQSLPLEKPVLDGLVAWLQREGRLVERNGRLATPEHRPAFGDEQSRQVEAIEAAFREQLFTPPTVDEVAQKAKLARPAVEKVVRTLCEHQRLVLIEGLYFHADAVAQARQRLIDHIQAKGRLESVEFKYLVDTTRKFALPLLDYFDRIGLLRRSGNTRYLKTPPGKS